MSDRKSRQYIRRMKKKNPDAIEDIKCAAKNAASKMMNKLENME